MLTAALPVGASFNQLGIVSEANSANDAAAIQTFIPAIGTRHWGRPALDRVTA